MSSGVRRMVEADIEAAASMQVEAFGGVVAEVVERYHNGPRSTWRDAWVVEMDGELRAAAVALPCRWWFGGQAYPVSAIAAVAVRPVDRRRGFASELMRGILRGDREMGRPYSVLYPYKHSFYRRLGYATAGLMHFWRMASDQLPDAPALRNNVRLVRESDRPLLEALYAAWLPTHSGFERNARQWARRWTLTDERWIAYEDAGAGLGGYLVYRSSGGTLEIRELIAMHSDAERGLWAFCAAQAEQRGAVTYHAPLDAPLWALLQEPHMYQAENRGFVLYDAATLTASFMVRVVDVGAALRTRPFPTSVRGRVSVAVQDPVFAPSGELYDIALEGGRADVRTAADAQVRCDVVTFTQVLCGALSPSKARWYGRLDADDASIALLDQAFPPGPPFIHPADWF